MINDQLEMFYIVADPGFSSGGGTKSHKSGNYQNIKECKNYTCWLALVVPWTAMDAPPGPQVKWVELPSSCVVLGSWSIFFFGYCLVNSCGGLIR